MARLESVLFLAREPLSSRKLSQLAGLADGTEARTLVRRLRKRYDQQGSSIQVEEVGGGFQLLTRARFAPWLRRLRSSPTELRLSGPAMETLSVVAYREPVLRAEIEAIRGVQCGEILRQLMDRDLVRIAGRARELGRPFLYATTRHFLRAFGLRTIRELPRAGQFGRPPKETETALENQAAESQDNETSEPVTSETKEPLEMTADTTHPITDEDRPVLVDEFLVDDALAGRSEKATADDEYEDEEDEDEEDEDDYEYEYEDGDDEDDDDEYEDDDEEDDEYEDGDEYEEDEDEDEDEVDEEEYEYEEVDDLDEDLDEVDEDEDDAWEDDVDAEDEDLDEDEEYEYEYEYEDDEEE